MQIKFRGKRIDTGEWIYGDLMTSPGSSGLMIAEASSIFPFTGRKDENEILEETLGQYLNIKDWKLQDIYQGDLVKTQQGTIFLVDYFKPESRWCLFQANKGSNPDLQGEWFSLGPHMQPNIEVIGNIHDNPELLK